MRRLRYIFVLSLAAVLGYLLWDSEQRDSEHLVGSFRTSDFEVEVKRLSNDLPIIAAIFGAKKQSDGHLVRVRSRAGRIVSSYLINERGFYPENVEAIQSSDGDFLMISLGGMTLYFEMEGFEIRWSRK